ncbi:MAG TPA: 2OG-Fe(II) oxygenase family protein [Candidatus Competibacteraceae bacterium]|nr:2OG-Fe(II) oxygenase family protein [Candidatus Competibacteraceae bacterium]
MPQERDRWIEASDVIPMFPTLLWKIQLQAELRAAIEAKILVLLAGMRRNEPALAPGQGWQSVQTLHEREELRDLVSCIHKAARGALKSLRIGYDAIEITACWANVLAPGAAHRMHSHPNNFLSGVYYLRTQPGADTINFHDPRVQTGIIRPPVTALTAENTDQVVVRVQNGTLLLFPSYLQHSVDANMSAEERVSLSFNLMFSAFTENLSKPLW